MKSKVGDEFERVVHCTLLRRYKRFLADVRLPDGSEVTVHCPNTGPMTGLVDNLPCPAVLSVSDSTTRKYAHTLEAVRPALDQAIVGVHSANANKLAQSILERRLVPALSDFVSLQREVKVNAESRIDFLLDRGEGKPKTYIEVKSVSLALNRADGSMPDFPPFSPGDLALDRHNRAPSKSDFMSVFPDTVSDRAKKHVEELIKLGARAGTESVMLLIVQRGDCDEFAPAWKYDLEYARAVERAAKEGVKVIAVGVGLELDARGESMEVKFRGLLPVNLGYMKEEAEREAQEKEAAKKTKTKGSGRGKKKAAEESAEGAAAPTGTKKQKT